MSRKKSKEPLLWAEVDLTALRSNLRSLRGLAGKDTNILAVVKADAYGHGMKAVASTLAREGVRFFGVANIDEAMKLRKICPSQKILALGSFHKNQLEDFFAHKIIPTLSCLEDATVLERFLRDKNSHVPVHVKIDTGMGRLGVWHEAAEGLFAALKKMHFITVEGIYTHFSSADKPDKSFTENQLRIFNRAVSRIKALGFHPRYLHAANSMGFSRFKEAHFNLIRPGIVLYGIHPAGTLAPRLKIKPLLSLKTRVWFLKNIAKGRPISYGASYHSKSPTRIATLPIGYSHGYLVGFSNKSHVLIQGRQCPVVGRVTMDQTLVDVGKISSIRRWNEVTLIGRDGNAHITAEELAAFANTIPYEILCAIHPRIPRIYKGLRN